MTNIPINLQTNNELHARQQLAAAYHLAARFGWTDLIYTHISASIPGELNSYLINPFGLMFEEVTPENLIKINYEGEILSNSNFEINPASLVIHSALHQSRPKTGCVIHLHTPNSIAISSVRRGLLPISQHALHLLNEISFHGYEGLAINESEKETIVNNLGSKKLLLMRNHGVLTAGESVAEAFMIMYFFERAAEIQIRTLSQGLPIVKPSTEICKKTAQQVAKNRSKFLAIEWQALLRTLKTPYIDCLLQAA